MKRIITFIILLYSAQFSFGQKTFTSRTEASTWLKETFSKCFVKTVYSTGQGSRRYYYDYELGDNYLVIKKKHIYLEGSANQKQELKWYSIFYNNSASLSQTTVMDENCSFILVKSDEITGGDGEYINPFRNQWKAFEFHFPFDLTKEKNTIESMQNAIDFINLYDKKVYKMYSDSVDLAKQEQELKAASSTSLIQFNVYTPDSVKINLHTYADNKRQFKDKPTLLVTFSNLWCRPCIMKIDTLLNSGLALEYNIILVNRDASTKLLALKTKISQHVPDFNTNTLLVFDRDDALMPLDQGQAPYFIFLDKNMEITSKLTGYKVRVLELKKQLKLIE